MMQFLVRLLIFYLLFSLVSRIVFFFAKLFLKRKINLNRGSAASKEYSRPNKRPAEKRNVVNAEFEEME